MTKLKRIGQGGIEKRKTAFQIRAQRLASLVLSRQAADAPVIIMPNGEPAKDVEIRSAIYFGMALGLSWVLGEENLPPTKWSMPK
jgi:hypothetical protein